MSREIERRLAPGATRMLGRFCRDNGGAMAILVALLLPVIIGMMGLTVDVGIWYAEKRSLQDTTDAAALAGGSEIANNGDISAITAAALADAGRNDYDPNTDSITVNSPPSSGPNAGNNGSVEVIIKRRMPLFFTTAFFKLIGASSQQFTAKARSVVNTAFVGQFCILGLDPNESRAVEIGSANVTLDCGIAVNSDASNALSIGGNGILNTTSVETIGQVKINGGGILNSDSPPRRRDSIIADPYEDLEIPPFAGCDEGALTGGGGFTASSDLDAGDFGGVMVICGDLTIAAGTTINFAPGVYIIDQGDFKINAGASVEGEGVTIILTSSGNDNKIGRFTVNGGADIELSAPTEDPAGAPGYAGVLFYQDRNVNTGGAHQNKFNGGTELDLEGALYFPSQSVEFSGGSDIGSGCTQLIGKKVKLSGDAMLETNCNSSGTRSIGRLVASLGE